MHNCCANEPKYQIEYDTGSVFKVCEKCFEDPYWSKTITNKKLLGK